MFKNNTIINIVLKIKGDGKMDDLNIELNNNSKGKFKITDKIVEFKDVKFKYKPRISLFNKNKDRSVFNLIINDLVIDKGEYVYIIGENGAGKTTFIKLLNGQLKPYSGSIRYKGTEVVNAKGSVITSVRRNIGYIFQDFSLMEDMTVKENILYPLEVVGGFSKEEKEERLYEILNKLDLDGKLDRLACDLSGGEKQKVAIARSLILDPDIIVADEPTGNLDPKVSEDIHNELNKLNKEGKTILMITHNKDFVNKDRHRVIKFDKGQVVSDIKGGVYE